MALEKKLPVYGVTVARSVSRCSSEILALLSQMDNIAHRGNQFIKEDACVHVLDNGGVPYGSCPPECVEMIKSIAASDGVYLDPIYNAKTFYTMIKHIPKMQVKNVLYINTGGSPNLFRGISWMVAQAN